MSDKGKRLILGFFGECGTGKSTVLTLIAKIYADMFNISIPDEMKFHSAH